MMDPIGNVLVKQEFEFTELWPDATPTLSGEIDLEKYYKEGLAGQMVKVMEDSRDKKEYLVFGHHKETGPFLWMIDKRDTVKGSFLPVIKKHGVLMPAGLSAIEEFKWLADLRMKGAL